VTSSWSFILQLGEFVQTFYSTYRYPLTNKRISHRLNRDKEGDTKSLNFNSADTLTPSLRRYYCLQFLLFPCNEGAKHIAFDLNV